MLLQFSPQREEMARFGRDVIAPLARLAVPEPGRARAYHYRAARRSSFSTTSR